MLPESKNSARFCREMITYPAYKEKKVNLGRNGIFVINGYLWKTVDGGCSNPC